MKLGTVGTGWITGSFIEAAQLSEKLTLTSVYSRSLEKAKQFADTYNAPFVFDNLEEMAKSDEIDVVYIASPNSKHFEQAKILLKNKKHVICEKPIFSNLKEWEQIFEIAEENGVFVFEAIRNLHSPNFNLLKENLGKIGKVRSAMLHYLQYSSRYNAFLKGEEPNVFSTQFSGGALVDLGVYPLYVAVGLFGEPLKISYHPVLLHNGVDGNGTLILEYKDFTSTILCSKISQSHIPSEIHGEQGTLVLDKVAPISNIECINHSNTEHSAIGVVQHDNDMVYEIENIVRIIHENDQNEYKKLSEMSRIVLSITEAARKQNNIVFGTEK